MVEGLGRLFPFWGCTPEDGETKQKTIGSTPIKVAMSTSNFEILYCNCAGNACQSDMHREYGPHACPSFFWQKLFFHCFQALDCLPGSVGRQWTVWWWWLAFVFGISVQALDGMLQCPKEWQCNRPRRPKLQRGTGEGSCHFLIFWYDLVHNATSPTLGHHSTLTYFYSSRYPHTWRMILDFPLPFIDVI